MSQALSLAELESFDRRAPQGGRERRFCCPMCGASKPIDAAHRSISVNITTGAWVCHRCSSDGKLVEWWQQQPAFSWRARKREMIKARFEVVRPPAAPPTPADQAKIHKIQVRYQECASLFAGSEAACYLAERGISESVALAAGCGYAANWQHWEQQEGNLVLLGQDQRVLFPVRDRSGELVAVATRAINDAYFSAQAITRGPKSLGVFATAGALQAEVAIITEAPIDALSLAMAGYPALALIGTSGPAWLRRHGAFRTVLIATDADVAGDLAAQKLTTELTRMGAHCLRLRPVGGKDWNEILLAQGANFISRQIDQLLGREPQMLDEQQAVAQPVISSNDGSVLEQAAVTTWDAEMEALISWAFTASVPSAPFLLWEGHFIAHPRRWYAELAGVINEGPLGARAELLRHELLALRLYVEACGVG